MKKFIYCTMVAAIISTIFVGCKKDKNLQNTNVTAVTNIFAPENNQFIALDPPEGTVTFEWQQAKSEDNGFVLYEVAFDKEDGDFSKPLYTVVSEKNGLDNKLTMTYGDLNKIAQMAGIQFLAKGKLKWTVMSSKGINVKMATESRLIEVERPEGFTVIPTDLFVTGTATEGGEDLAQAAHFRRTAPGEFEGYTKLKAGTYQFVNDNEGTPTVYSAVDSKLTEGGSITVTGDEKIYRIKANFNTKRVEFTEVVSVGLWFSPEGKVLFTMPYAGKGVWLAENKPIVFRQEGWGRDERYKFRIAVKNAAGEDAVEFFGSKNGDNSRPDANTPPEYFDVVPVSSAQYDNSFKFSGAADNKNVDVRLDFSANPLTHSVTVK